MPSDPRDYKVDIGGLNGDGGGGPPAVDRPFLGVRFACCGTYVRAYRSEDGRRYQARCPRCGKAANFAVGVGGTSARFFVAE